MDGEIKLMSEHKTLTADGFQLQMSELPSRRVLVVLSSWKTFTCWRKLAHFNRERILSGSFTRREQLPFGTFTTQDITRYSKAKVFSSG